MAFGTWDEKENIESRSLGLKAFYEAAEDSAAFSDLRFEIFYALRIQIAQFSRKQDLRFDFIQCASGHLEKAAVISS